MGGAVIAYNLGSGFNNNVKLTATEVADIYNGTITKWSDPQIVATNGGAQLQSRRGADPTRNDERAKGHDQGVLSCGELRHD